MSKNIIIKEFQAVDFINIDSGSSAITITLFQGKMAAITPGWANSMELSPDQAETVAHELIKQAEAVKKSDRRK